MKKFFAILYLALITNICLAQEKHISYIEKTNSMYFVYDESGKKISTLSRSGIGVIKGWGSTFFIAQRGSLYLICDAKGKTLKTLGAQTIGKILSVSGNTFTSQNGSFIYTYNKEGKCIKTRGATTKDKQ